MTVPQPRDLGMSKPPAGYSATYQPGWEPVTVDASMIGKGQGRTTVYLPPAPAQQQTPLLQQLQAAYANADPYSSDIWGSGTAQSPIRQTTIGGKTYWYVPGSGDQGLGQVSTGGSEGHVRQPNATPIGQYNYDERNLAYNQQSPGGLSPTLNLTGNIYDTDPYTDLSNYKAGEGGGQSFLKSDLPSLAPLAIAAAAYGLAPAAAAGTGELTAADLAGVGGMEIPTGTAASGAGSSLGGLETGSLLAAPSATGMTSAEMAAMGGMEIPAGTAASGAGPSLGGLDGLTAADLAGVGGMEIPAGTAASGAGGTSDAVLNGGLYDVMPGATQAASGATGGIGGSAPGGLANLAGNIGTWIKDNPLRAVGLATALGGLFNGGSGQHFDLTGGSGGGGAGSGKSLPVFPAMNRSQTPYTGNYNTYGRNTATDGGKSWNFFKPPAAKRGGGVSPLTRMAAQSQQSRYLAGPTGGQDDVVPIDASHGEYVVDASTVSDLGDGNNEAGAGALDQMVQQVRKHKRTSGRRLPPKAKAPLEYLRGKV